MAYIKLSKAGITFSIYNSKTRSLRNQLFRSAGGKINSIDNTIYVKALENIDLEIKQGDRIGIIGHNGAGKSTMLKLLAGIYEPTSGQILLEGSISSLTDITMGMDPELSGYDNIITRCIFMGMTFKEARSKVDEVIDFSELQEYINLPMRTYSSGMYMRLAFTIATCITPDILIMDEMIGTGDAAFIEKTRKRSASLIENTKIMILSSHDMQIIKDICNRVIWMEKGSIRAYGPHEQIIDEYHLSLL